MFQFVEKKWMVGYSRNGWIFWKFLNNTKKILKEFMANSQNTKILEKLLELNMIDGNFQMKNQLKNWKK